MEWKTTVKHLSSHLFWLMLETLSACIILHLRSRKDFAGKTKHRRTGLKQKTINLPLLIWIYVIYWFLNCLSPEEKKPKETIYIVSFSNRSKLKPFNNGNGRVVSSSCTSLTHSQVNLLVIKSTPCTFSPGNEGWLWKWMLAVFPSSQLIRCCSCSRSWADQYTKSFEWRLRFQIWDQGSWRIWLEGVGWVAYEKTVSSSPQPEPLPGKTAAMWLHTRKPQLAHRSSVSNLALKKE